MWYEPLLDKGLLPDPILRAGIRKRLGQRIDRELKGSQDDYSRRYRDFVRELRESPIAIETDKANEQHYELPPEFFELCLGSRRKYSGCLWRDGVNDLDQAEDAMLKLTCERAQIEDGMDILDLGCGWGSLSLYIKEKFPNCNVLGVSNSSLQRDAITKLIQKRGHENIEILTADANTLDLGRTFDRIISIEMFEHMKNYKRLLANLSTMMRDDAKLFVHIFTHTRIAYHYEPGNDWIGKYFFTGGTMPSDDLLCHFQDDVTLTDHWRVDGTHYEKTANAWLAKMDSNKDRIMPILRDAYGDEATAWFHRWRVFFLACAELWGFRGGSEWIVSHYLFETKHAAMSGATPNATRDLVTS